MAPARLGFCVAASRVPVRGARVRSILHRGRAGAAPVRAACKPAKNRSGHAPCETEQTVTKNALSWLRGRRRRGPGPRAWRLARGALSERM